MSNIPSYIADNEVLHRRIHPAFIKSDGSISSQAFRDPEMSVDRASYRATNETMANYSGFGLAGLFAMMARELEQEVVAAPELLNPAHALVVGGKSKSIAKRLVRMANWLIPLVPREETG